MTQEKHLRNKKVEQSCMTILTIDKLAELAIKKAGNKRKLCIILGISRTTLYSILKGENPKPWSRTVGKITRYVLKDGGACAGDWWYFRREQWGGAQMNETEELLYDWRAVYGELFTHRNPQAMWYSEALLAFGVMLRREQSMLRKKIRRTADPE
jgi:hypothetical protein